MLAQLEKNFPDDLRVIYRHFPLNIHDKAALSVQAAEAAGLQGKFWEMHDLLFNQRDQWVGLDPTEFPKWAIDQASSLGLDVKKFESDMNSQALVTLAKDAWDKNVALGMPGTPFIMINNRQYNGRTDYGNLLSVVKILLLEKRQFSACPTMALDPNKHYLAVLHTEKGDITLDLFADKTPLAVNSFIFLARQGWFDGVTFHRVLANFVAQAGDPSGTGFGNPGYAFDNEIWPDLTFDGPGVVGMANAGAGSNGSQFFITLASAHQLDGDYTIFARVIAGMDVVQKLTPRDPEQGIDLPPGDKIISVTIEEQ